MKHSTELLEYFYNTQHAGTLDQNDPNVIVVEEGGAEQGNILRLYLQIRNQTIVTVKFLAYSSVAATACCEYVCRWLEGKTLEQARKINAEEIMKALELPGVEIHTAKLVERLVKKSLKG